MTGRLRDAAMRGMGRHVRLGLLAGSAIALTAIAGAASAAPAASIFDGNLVVTSLTYEGRASTITVGHPLPITPTADAIANGAYPQVFLNDGPDGNFGVAAPYTLKFFQTDGTKATMKKSFHIPNYYVIGGSSGYFAGSFSSKSEGAINVSPDGQSLTLMGYDAPTNALDASNANTTASTETGNSDIAPDTDRVVAQINSDGTMLFTNTTTYPGNNPRAVVLAPDGYYYMAGNGGNGNGDGNIGTLVGVQKMAPGAGPTSQQIGAFSVTQVGLPADKKPFKDNNYRGETLFNNTLYVTKGSGSNGLNTVYQVGQTGEFASGGSITTGVSTPITPLPGFPVQSAKNDTNFFPFGIWFANATTLYVADEGAGTLAGASTDTNAGLEKWQLQGDNKWHLLYVLQTGLNLGQNYTVSGVASQMSGSYTTATDGLRNITGRINKDGTVTIYAITSTVSNTAITGDQGADPNKLVAITDDPNATTPALGEQFNTLYTAAYGEVLRGVAMTECRAQKSAPCN